MKCIVNENSEILFTGDRNEMQLAYEYLTESSYKLAKTRGLKMADIYELNAKYWKGKAKEAKAFYLADA